MTTGEAAGEILTGRSKFWFIPGNKQSLDQYFTIKEMLLFFLIYIYTLSLMYSNPTSLRGEGAKKSWLQQEFANVLKRHKKRKLVKRKWKGAAKWVKSSPWRAFKGKVWSQGSAAPDVLQGGTSGAGVGREGLAPARGWRFCRRGSGSRDCCWRTKWPLRDTRLSVLFSFPSSCCIYRYKSFDEDNF